MGILIEDAAEAVRINFRRLSPGERRQVLAQLMAEQDSGRIEVENGSNSGSNLTSGSLLEWLEEKTVRVELELFLRHYLSDFESSALSDSSRRAAINRQLSSLSPFTLYELYQKLIKADRFPRLTPEEIIERTWGTISGVDRQTLREIIEDEDYCGY